MDLLEHEVLVAALLGHLGRPGDRRDRSIDRPPGDVGDRHPARAQVGDVALLEEDDLVGVGEDRHVHPRPDEAVGLATMHDRDRVGTFQPGERGSRRVGDVATVGVLDQVGDGLGVSLGCQLVAFLLELIAQLPEVLDDPVVDHRDVARAVLVGMRVEIVRPPVRRPAGVSQPDRRMGRAVLDGGLKHRQLAGPLLHEQVALLVDERDAGRVVTAVFEPAKAFDQDRTGFARSGVANDAAHAGAVLRGRPRRNRKAGLV